MFININFTLDIDTAQWADDKRPAIERLLPSKFPFTPPDINDPDVVDRISKEVRAHAENVIRDLYEDMGWIGKTA
jgi:hypothetical protein